MFVIVVRFKVGAFSGRYLLNEGIPLIVQNYFFFSKKKTNFAPYLKFLIFKDMKNLFKLISASLFGAVAATAVPAAAAVPAPEWINNAVIYEANLRQGTPERNLKGLEKQLPRLKDLGVDIIWLMPIHPISEVNRKGELGSYYAVKDYKAVNPEFGTLDDLKDFVKTAHQNGLYVILDEVCNHTGADNAWVTEHPDWYEKDANGNFVSPFDWTDVYELDYSNPETRAAMTDALKFWIEEADIDG